MSHIYASIAYTLRTNAANLCTDNLAYRRLLTKIANLRLIPSNARNISDINFYLCKTVRMKFQSSTRYRSNTTLQEEIKVLHSWLDPSSGVSWESPMGHLIPHTP